VPSTCASRSTGTQRLRREHGFPSSSKRWDHERQGRRGTTVTDHHQGRYDDGEERELQCLDELVAAGRGDRGGTTQATSRSTATTGGSPAGTCAIRVAAAPGTGLPRSRRSLPVRTALEEAQSITSNRLPSGWQQSVPRVRCTSRWQLLIGRPTSLSLVIQNSTRMPGRRSVRRVRSDRRTPRTAH